MDFSFRLTDIFEKAILQEFIPFNKVHSKWLVSTRIDNFSALFPMPLLGRYFHEKAQCITGDRLRAIKRNGN